ncbi:hypothetical protein ATCC53582_02179 [Novacetimonas hansenii]|nr:hypothetical protein ATCC53582_02179 [Novacetimonas hansenii]
MGARPRELIVQQPLRVGGNILPDARLLKK